MACGQQTVVETYWTVCWKWIFPYPCKKSRTVSRWCCDFAWVEETGYGFFCRLQGCADGQLYKWTAFCFNIWGTTRYPNIRKCFGSAKTPVGPCEPGPTDVILSKSE
jgi:hypothetical protein